MDVKWTSEQKKVIDLRDRDILVSAAAGSGKTAVLVERIVNRICVDNPPVDIDRMLVVTFTKAAAAEMRERVSRAIDSLKEQSRTMRTCRGSRHWFTMRLSLQSIRFVCLWCRIISHSLIWILISESVTRQSLSLC